MIPILEFIKKSTQPVNIAHRGGMALYPENTLTGFHASVHKYKVDMLEMDLQLTRDDKVIVLHDDSLDRTTNGKGEVSRLSYKEISQFDGGFRFKNDKGEFPFRDQGIKVPLFENILKEFPQTFLNIELKGNNRKLIQKAADLINKYKAENRILIGAGKFNQNKQIHQILSECGHYLSQPDIYLFCILGSCGFGRKYWEKFHVVEVPLYYHGLHVYTLLRKAADKMGLPIIVWGANDLQTIDKLKADDVDGIITDRPDLM